MASTQLILIGGIIFFPIVDLLGFSNIINKDRAWKWQVQKNRRKGISDSERTPEWEDRTTLMGIILVVWSAACTFLAVFTLVNL